MLHEAGVNYQRRDLFKEPLSVDELRDLFREMGMRPAEVVSTRSVPYRTMGLATRHLDDEQLLTLMSAHPGLIRRPIVTARDDGQIGFNRSALEALARQYGQGNADES